MKKTLAKGGKTEKNMKKQSILNLVNSILLLCTLLFSVISFAWYTNSTNIAPPLSFTAQDVDSLEGLVMIKFDDIRSANDKVIKPAQTGETLDHLGAERFPETVPDTLNFELFCNIIPEPVLPKFNVPFTLKEDESITIEFVPPVILDIFNVAPS
jgi:hypothetical protein